ncbi:MAG: DUF4389 domain-containing protein [Gammaproteobacteria bacterium]|nr:DUF4389 domain-containing protein [Gammaproteobacteria bacterium]
MSRDYKKNLKQTSTWKRGLYMLLFAIFYGIAEVVLVAIIVFQFLLKLITDETNEKLLDLGQNLSTYIYEILQYLSFNSDYKPYPFGEWPNGEPQPGKHTVASEKEMDKALDHIEQDVDVDGD